MGEREGEDLFRSFVSNIQVFCLNLIYSSMDCLLIDWLINQIY